MIAVDFIYLFSILFFHTSVVSNLIYFSSSESNSTKRKFLEPPPRGSRNFIRKKSKILISKSKDYNK